jgi:CubicO group peptidase (beta-lactamase class C family)
MWKNLILVLAVSLTQSSCRRDVPEPWNGPVLTRPRTQLTVDQLMEGESLGFLDMSFFSRPEWARTGAERFSGSISFTETEMVFPMMRESYPGELLFPKVTLEFITDGRTLVPMRRGVIDTRPESDSYWDVSVGPGVVWREEGDEGWSRASFPLNLLGRYVGEVRNCVGTFVYRDDAMSNVSVQCSQETAVLEADQLGDIRAMVPATYEPGTVSDADGFLEGYHRRESRRIPVAPLSELDSEQKIAEYFDRSLETNASTSLGAIYLDGTLYVHPPRTRHGLYPYPGEMRHGVFSVTKSMAGALAMFYFAERYGEEIFDALIVDYVPAFADLPEWQGVTFSHTLNMVTGTRAGDRTEEDLLYEPLELAPDKETAIQNIAQFGDYPEAPGEKFNYATTNTFVLSYALQNYVEEREGEGVQYWDLVEENVLTPIGAEGFRVLHTRDEDTSERIPILGLGGFPTVDAAAKIALLIFNEGEHEGSQVLNRNRIREALGRTEWQGYPAGSRTRYRHSFWSRSLRAGGCRFDVAFMEGLGGNHVLLLPGGVLVFRFMDELDMDFVPLVRAVERVRSSCP